MRMFNSASVMVKEVERDLFEMGIKYQSATVQDQNVADNKDFQTIELMGYTYSLGYPRSTDNNPDFRKMLEYMNTPIEWVIDECDERLGKYYPVDEFASPPILNPGTAYLSNRDFWQQYLRRGCFSYSYAERWQYQLPYIIRELKRCPTTRQAVMTMYDVHQDMMNWGGADRVPCSLTYHFIIRNGYMYLIYNQRSCDFMKFFASDVYLTFKLLEHVAAKCDVPVGRMVHVLGSLHAFHSDLKERNIF